jgi:hypothetical protein
MVEEVVENTPEWLMYCVLNKDPNVLQRFDRADFWDKLINEMLRRSEEVGVGDVKERHDTLANSFRLPVDPDTVEEFDGANHEDAHKLIFLVSLPVIMRGHSIQLKLSTDLLKIRVPTMYSLKLGLPNTVDTHDGTYHAFFDCKLRKLILVLNVYKKPIEVIIPQ